MEVRQEEAKKALTGRKSELLQNLAAEREVQRKLEAAEQTLVDRKNRKVDKAYGAYLDQQEARKKAEAASIAGAYMKRVKNAVLGDLASRDPLAVTIEAKFLPWVYSQANQRLEGVRAGRQAVEELLRGAIEREADEKRKADAPPAASGRDRGSIIFMIEDSNTGDKMQVGPIKLTPDATIGDLTTWVKTHLQNPKRDQVVFFNRTTKEVLSQDRSLYRMGSEGLRSIGMRFD